MPKKANIIIANASTTLTLIYWWRIPLWHIFQNREINFLSSERREKFIASSELAQGYREKCSWQGWMFVAARALIPGSRCVHQAARAERASEPKRPPAAENSPGPQVHTAPPRRLTPRQQHSRAHNAPAPCALACSPEAQPDNNRDWEWAAAPNLPESYLQVYSLGAAPPPPRAQFDADCSPALSLLCARGQKIFNNVLTSLHFLSPACLCETIYVRSMAAFYTF